MHDVKLKIRLRDKDMPDMIFNKGRGTNIFGCVLLQPFLRRV